MDRRIALWILLCVVSVPLFLSAIVKADSNENGINFLQRYPTTLTVGDTVPDRARPWRITTDDIYRLESFSLSVGESLHVQVGLADIGIGHCSDGAVLAVILPREEGHLASPASREPETIDHVWLRFHPKEVVTLFPENTVHAKGDKSLLSRIQRIANIKIFNSWHAGRNAMIPPPGRMTVDVDTKEGVRRFFDVDRNAITARYAAVFADRAVPVSRPVTEKTATASFDLLWEAFDREYAMFMLRPEVDWNKLGDEYRPKAANTKTTHEFASVCAEMLSHLRDLHVWVKIDGEHVPVFNRPRESNANPSAYTSIVGELERFGKSMEWSKTKDKIGFVAIHSWNDKRIPEKFDEILEEMRDTRGMIVDVRLNGGGSEPLAREVAGRFLRKAVVYAHSQFRNGPKHTDLTEKRTRSVRPRGPWCYDRDVIVLIGQKCMSSNESFISMMAEASQVTTMGDHTCGSSGNPRMVNLPVGVTVSVPRWIDCLADGTPLDEHGIQPDVLFKPKPGVFEAKRDDLLTAAIQRLRKAPLPKDPIPGTSVYTIRAEAEALEASRPKVVSVWPPNGAKDVEPVTEIRIRFDQPMNELAMKLDWDKGAYLESDSARYLHDRKEFLIPLRLLPGTTHRLKVNERFGWHVEGFKSTEGVVASEYAWSFKTKSASRSRDAVKPTAVNVHPQSGSTVALLTLIRVKFDQPMDPYRFALRNFAAKPGPLVKPQLLRQVEYDPQQYQFTLPVSLAENWKGWFELYGFESAQGVRADPIQIEYKTQEAAFSESLRERIEKARQNPQLRLVLEKVQQARRGLSSLSEREQDIHYWKVRKDYFTGIRSNTATFKMQGDRQFFADVSEHMGSCSAFCIGSDGNKCWWHIKSKRGTKLVTCPFEDMHEKNVQICDPFGLMGRDPARAIDELQLEYLGISTLDGHACHLIQSWNCNQTFPHITRWWINAETYQLVQLVQYGGGIRVVRRFFYDCVNEKIPDSEFRPKLRQTVNPEEPKPLDKDYNIRFLNVIDGSNGRMSCRWGRRGPKGKYSSGLN